MGFSVIQMQYVKEKLEPFSDNQKVIKHSNTSIASTKYSDRTEIRGSQNW